MSADHDSPFGSPGPVDKLLGDANRAIFVGDFTQTGKTAGETENLFPEGYPLAAVRKAYGEIDLSFNAEEKQIPDIIDRLTALIPSAAPASCRRFRPTSSW